MKGKRFLTIIRVAWFALFTALIAPIPVFAQQAPGESNQNIPKMDEMVVTATKVEEPKKDVPEAVQVITSEDIKDSTAKDAGGLITEAGLGHITNYGTDLTGSIEIRGLQTDLFNPLESRVLILVNGSNAGTVDLAKIPVDDIERVEIIKGPASVLYGSSAMGGVINIITKEGTGDFHGSVGGLGGSWDYWKTAADVGGTYSRFDYYAMVSTSSRGDADAGNAQQIANSAYNDESASARLGYKLFDDNHLSFGFQHWMGWDIGSPGPTYDPSPYDYDNKKRDAFDADYRSDTIQAKYYRVWDTDIWHSISGGMTSGTGFSSIYQTDTETQGASIQKILSFGDQRVIFGGQWDRMEIYSRSYPGTPYYPDALYDTYGAFAEGRASLLQKKLLLSLGFRYDYFDNSILATPGITNLIPSKAYLDHLTTRGGLVYKITDNLSFKGTVGTAFRAPAPLELAADYVYYGTQYVGNPDLRPEQSTTYDAGLSYLKGPFTGDLTFFHTEFKDQIVPYFDTSRNVSTYNNAGGATIEGVEFNSAYDVGATLGLPLVIEPFTNITYKFEYLQRNRGFGPDTTELNTPKWTGAFGLRVGQQKWDCRLIANYIGQEKVIDYNFSDVTYGQTIPKSGFTVVSLKASYRPIKSLELTASVQNLLDRYYAYNIGYPMPGMTFMAGAKWLF